MVTPSTILSTFFQGPPGLSVQTQGYRHFTIIVYYLIEVMLAGGFPEIHLQEQQKIKIDNRYTALLVPL